MYMVLSFIKQPCMEAELALVCGRQFVPLNPGIQGCADVLVVNRQLLDVVVRVHAQVRAGATTLVT